MLRQLFFQFGAGPEQPRLRCRPSAVTVFVGPNNAGKSQALREIAELVGAPLSKRDARGRTFGNPGAISTLLSEPVSPHAARVILRGVQASLPRDKLLRSTFIKAVAMDLEALAKPLKGAYETFPNWSQLKTLFAAVGMFAHAAELGEEGKLDLRRVGLQENVEPHSSDLVQQEAFSEFVQHAKRGRFRTLARRWIGKRIIRLSGYIKLLVPHTIVLDGTTRLTLVDSTKAPDWRGGEDANLLVNLIKKPEHIETLRRIIHNALGMYPVIDTTHANTTHLKMSKEPPQGRERSTDPEALQYFDQAQPISAFSDGVRSFVGLLAAVLSGDHKVILMDEPEAFLHPPLARRLGTELHKLAREQHAQVFAATHSPDFLMGCIQAGTDVEIVRLTYMEGQATARELKPERLKHIMRHPLLRSTGVLGALFHAGAVVCESDSDRAFYQEINERLVAVGRGAQDVAFLNAQNKQTIVRIIEPLRQMGIPAAAVLDLDVLSPGEDLGRLLRAAGTPPVALASLTSLKNQFFNRCKELTEGDADQAKKQLKLKGLHLLPEREREEFHSVLLRPLAERGIFVVPEGELESWLSSQGAEVGRSDKSKWLMKIFEQLGDDPDRPEYVRPGPQDVWAFMDKVAAWIAKPKLGIPSAD